MNVKAICVALVVAIMAAMGGVILRLTWKASKEKAAKQARNDARAVTALQGRASQAAVDACNTDGQLEGALGDDTF